MSFTRTNAGDGRDSFSGYYVSNIEINDFNVLIHGKRLFDLPVQENYRHKITLSTWAIIVTGNLTDFAYFKDDYKLIAIDLSKQTKLKDP